MKKPPPRNRKLAEGVDDKNFRGRNHERVSGYEVFEGVGVCEAVVLLSVVLIGGAVIVSAPPMSAKEINSYCAPFLLPPPPAPPGRTGRG